jgi:V/A-type H+-transporting ATPase subunit B
MIDTGWELFAKYFTVAETGIKAEFVEKYGKRKNN